MMVKKAKKKIGLYFGSFNPIHIGHMIIANAMLTHADISELWFVVSPQNPFKKNQHLLHEFDRLDLVELAIANHPEMKASDVEFHMPKPSYTVDTLTYLSEKFPDFQFRLIIGGDNLPSFHKWKNHQIILEHYGLLVYPRPGAAPSLLERHPRVQFVQAPILDISATYIRKCIKTGKSIQYLVPKEVEEQIIAKKFYF